MLKYNPFVSCLVHKLTENLSIRRKCFIVDMTYLCYKRAQCFCSRSHSSTLKPDLFGTKTNYFGFGCFVAIEEPEDIEDKKIWNGWFWNFKKVRISN